MRTQSPADCLSSLSASAKSRLAVLSQRPSSEPGCATCTQPCPQPPEPGEGALHPQDHPNHEVRFSWEHPEAQQPESLQAAGLHSKRKTPR